MTEWFSADSAARQAAAAPVTVPTSSGLITGTLTTRTPAPCRPSSRAAASAGASIIPLANRATSSPGVSTSARSSASG